MTVKRSKGRREKEKPHPEASRRKMKQAKEIKLTVEGAQ